MLPNKRGSMAFFAFFLAESSDASQQARQHGRGYPRALLAGSGLFCPLSAVARRGWRIYPVNGGGAHRGRRRPQKGQEKSPGRSRSRSGYVVIWWSFEQRERFSSRVKLEKITRSAASFSGAGSAAFAASWAFSASSSALLAVLMASHMKVKSASESSWISWARRCTVWTKNRFGRIQSRGTAEHIIKGFQRFKLQAEFRS